VVRTGLGYKFDWVGYSSGGPSVMPVKTAAASAWSWSGFYLGGHAGYGWGRDPFDDLINGASATVAPVFWTGIKSQGFVGGFQAGANWQGGKVVGGLEVDLSSAPIKGSSSVATGVNLVGTPFAAVLTDKFDWLGSARARLGYLVSPNVMLYGTGGLGWTGRPDSNGPPTGRDEHRDGTELESGMGRGRRCGSEVVQHQLARPSRIPALRLR